MPLTGAYYPRAACCNTDLALLLCHRQQPEQQATISPPPSVRKIGLRIQRCTAAHARCADRLTISTIHAIACSKDAWRTGHRAGTLHHDIPIIVTVHNTGRKISGWRMTDSHEYGVGVQRAFQAVGMAGRAVQFHFRQFHLLLGFPEILHPLHDFPGQGLNEIGRASCRERVSCDV